MHFSKRNLFITIPLFISLLTMSQPENSFIAQVKPKIIYVYDPLCGWCYGFTPVIQKLANKFKNKFDFDILSGGMVTGSRIEPITKIAPYIAEAHKKVQDYTGIKFGESFLKNRLWDSSYIMNSENPSLVLTVFKSFKPENAIDFAHDIQSAFYFEGKSLNDNATYLQLIKPYQIDEEDFRRNLELPEFKNKMKEEFKYSASLGVSGFPTVVLITTKDTTVLSRGYTDFNELNRVLENL